MNALTHRRSPAAIPVGLVSMAGLAVLFVASLARAQTAVEVEDVEEIEEVEDVSPGTPAAKAEAAKPAKAEAVEPAEPAPTGGAEEPPLTLMTLAGHFHPAVVHFPIAWLVLLLLVELAALRFSVEGLGSLGLWLHAGLVASFIPAIVSGLIRANELPSEDPNDVAAVLQHRNLMLIAAALCLVALGQRWMKRREFSGPRRYIYVAVLASATLIVTYSGHQGGKLVYGEDFFPF